MKDSAHHVKPTEAVACDFRDASEDPGYKFLRPDLYDSGGIAELANFGLLV
jgi:hypothetical protein